MQALLGETSSEKERRKIHLSGMLDILLVRELSHIRSPALLLNKVRGVVKACCTGGQSLVHIYADSSHLNRSSLPRPNQQRRLGPGLIG